MNDREVITFKKLFKQQQIVVLIVEFLSINDLLHLLSTCKRIREILKYPEIQRIVLKCKASSLKKVYNRVFFHRQNFMVPVPMYNIYNLFTKPQPPKEPIQKRAKMPDIFKKLVQRREVRTQPSQDEEKLMFETIRRKMEEEARVNEDVMDRMTPMLFKHYYADDEGPDLRKFCPVYQAKVFSRGLAKLVREKFLN